MKPNVIIRPAQHKDSDRILSLLGQIANYHHINRPDLFRQGGTKYSREQLEKIFSDQNRPIFVATCDSDFVVGYCFCQAIKYESSTSPHMNSFTELYIDDLCVDQDFRRFGIGKMLFEQAKEFAKESGACRLTLGVFDFNQSGIEFYESFGMKSFVRRMELEL